MRVLLGIAAGVGAVVGAAAGIGFVIARRLTAPASGRVFDLVVRDVVVYGDAEAVVVDRTARTEAPGLYNLWLEGAGWVRLDADAGLGAEDVVIDTPVGRAPAWLIPGAGDESDHWAIHIHGMGSPRAGTLRGVQVAAEAGLTSLVVTYRNDGEGPRVGSGRSTLGATETEDVCAALRFALARGARRITLFGWSMGGAIALQLAADAEFDGVIDRLVLDSPVLNWQATINANCRRARLPWWCGVFARPWLQSRFFAPLLGLRSEIPLDQFNWITRVHELTVPTLILHPTEDWSAPLAVSDLLAMRRPGLVRLETVRSDHTMSWNLEPERWRSLVAL